MLGLNQPSKSKLHVIKFLLGTKISACKCQSSLKHLKNLPYKSFKAREKAWNGYLNVAVR